LQPAMPPPVAMRERYAMTFARAILSRPHVFTIVFLVANFFVFLLMWQESEMASRALLVGFDPGVLLDYGAKTNYNIRFEHEYWRFVTPVFIHGNLPHLLMNMYGLWVLGPWVEKLYGSARFVVFWVVTGIAGVVASYLTVVPGARPGLIGGFLIKRVDQPSVGASGALFGLIGVLFVFGLKYRRELPEGFKRAFGTGLLPVILLNVAIGFLAGGVIDNAAHMGGLVAGMALTAIVDYKRPGQSTGLTVAWRIAQIAALLLVLISFVFVIKNFG
jgi:rhomboid protease GluP